MPPSTTALSPSLAATVQGPPGGSPTVYASKSSHSAAPVQLAEGDAATFAIGGAACRCTDVQPGDRKIVAPTRGMAR